MSFNAQMKSSEAEAEVEVEVESERPLTLTLALTLFFRLFSWPIIKVGSGKPRMLYHQRWRSPLRVLVPIKPRRYCLETFSILITTGIGSECCLV
jgi:hypothetical protein